MGGLTHDRVAAAIAGHAFITQPGATARAEEEIAAEIALAGETGPTTELPLHPAVEPYDLGDGFDADAHIGQEGLTDGAKRTDLARAAGLTVRSALGAH